MKTKFPARIISLLFLCAFALSIFPASLPADQTVYVTNTGSKYHAEGCRYLRRSCIPIALSEAIQMYEPCSVCDPPTEVEKPKPKVKKAAKKKTVVQTQCQAMTKKGTQCTRKAKAGSKYCWQHQGN